MGLQGCFCKKTSSTERGGIKLHEIWNHLNLYRYIHLWSASVNWIWCQLLCVVTILYHWPPVVMGKGTFSRQHDPGYIASRGKNCEAIVFAKFVPWTIPGIWDQICANKTSAVAAVDPFHTGKMLFPLSLVAYFPCWTCYTLNTKLCWKLLSTNLCLPDSEAVILN